MSDKKVYPVVKKVSLAGLSEGWDESCFAYVVPTSYLDQKDVTESSIKSMTPGQQVEYQLQFVRDRFVSGKIKAFDGSEFVEIDMEPEHTTASVEVTDRLYAEIMGLGLDPKDIRKAVTENALQSGELKATETSSSEENQSGSPIATT